MPTVPSYGGAPRVQQSAGNANLGQITARPDAEAFNAGESLNKVTSAATALYDKVRNDADQVAVLDADARLAEYQTRALYDPATGALNKKGKDAFGSVESVNEDLDKQLSEIESGLSNNAQKAAFRQKALQAKDQINRSLNQHVATEIGRYDNEKTEAYLTSQRNLVTANPYDPVAVQTAKESQAAALYQFAERTGKPPEWAQLKIQEAESATNMSALQKMMADGNDIAAEEYFKAHAETFHGQDRLQATKMVEEGSALGKAMRKSDEDFQKGMSLTAMMAEARGIENPKVRQAYEHRVQVLDQQRKQAKADWQEKTNISIANAIDQGEGYDSWAKKNPQAALNLTEQQRTAARNYELHRGTRTDGVTNYDLETLAVTDPQAYLKTDLAQKFMAGQINRSEYSYHGKLQNDLRQGKGETEVQGIYTKQQVENDALALMKLKNDDPRAVAYRQTLQKETLAEAAARGKKHLTIEEIREVSDRIRTEQIEVPGMLWGTNQIRKFEATPAQLVQSEIPSGERSKIRSSLQARGIPLTDENILTAYDQMQKAKRASATKTRGNVSAK